MLAVNSLQKYTFLLLSIFSVFNYHISCQSLSDMFNSNWNEVTITKLVAPEFYLSPYQNLIIAKIVNERGRKDNETQVIYNKIASEIQKIPNINLLDRENTELILNEYKLQSTGYVEEDYTTPFGKFFSSGIIMTARIIDSDYKEDVITSSSLSNTKSRYRKGIHTMSLSIQFIDIATTQVVYSRTVDAKYSLKTKKDYSTPPRINKNEVYLNCVNLLSENFKNLFVTHEVDYTIEFQKNSKFNDELKKAAALVQVEEFDMAYQKLKAILNNKKVLKSEKAQSSAYYNLAMLELYTDKYEEAKKNAKIAYLKNPNNEKCLKLVKILQ